MEGWICINRQIKDHWLWSDAERLKWWLDLLFMANWEDKEVLKGNYLVKIERGQMIASVTYLMQRWGRSKNTVRDFLSLLEKEQMITRTLTHHESIITICNYGKYQDPTTTTTDPLADPLTDPLTDPKQTNITNITNNISLSKSAHANYNNNNGAEWSEVESLYKELRNLFTQPSETRNSYMRRSGKSAEDLVKYLDMFQEELKATASVSHRTRNDYRQYFLNWLLKQAERESRKEATKESVATDKLHNIGKTASVRYKF